MLFRSLGVEAPIEEWVQAEEVSPDILQEHIATAANTLIEGKQTLLGEESWVQVEKSVLLQSLDHHWKDHLSTLDALRQVVHLRAYAQKTPINEYKQEAFALFERMLDAIREDVTRVLAHAQFMAEPPPLPQMPDFITSHIDPLTGEDDTNDRDAGSGFVTTRLPPLPVVRMGGDEELGDDPADWEGKVSRNAACPCGSGKKYKHCHGAL